MELHLRYFAAVAEELHLGRAAERLHNVGVRLFDRTQRSVAGDQQLAAEAARGLAALAYELLDAHVDTARLADGLASDPSWAAHLDYLRALQREGREALACAPTAELSSCRSDDLGWLDVR